MSDDRVVDRFNHSITVEAHSSFLIKLGRIYISSGKSIKNSYNYIRRLQAEVKFLYNQEALLVELSLE